MSKLFLIFWFFVSSVLFVYSYGFLDFNLTLSSSPIFLDFVAPLQHLVYFDRHVSAAVFAVIMFLLFSCYIALRLYDFTTKSGAFPWLFVSLVVLILTLAYPMLSYDVFNYMFHGKILWFYHQNPHLHAPLEYTGDLWLRFMRWVHTPSAYGPVFTAIESPAYLLGLGKFVPVLYLMKITMSAFFVYCIYLVGKIGEILKYSKDKIIGVQSLLALNPFLLFELVINGHNDAVMIALSLLSLYYLLLDKKIKSILALVLSIGTKYVTALTLPLYLLKKPSHKILFFTLILLVPVLVSPGRFQPWYLTWSLIPAVLIDRPWSRLWIYLTSIAGLIYYIPYIYTGFWSESNYPAMIVMYLPVLLTLLYTRLVKRSL